MTAYRVQTTLDQDGRLSLTEVPARAGERVEVIVLIDRGEPAPPTQEEFPLRGKEPYRFDDPFTPAVPAEDWDALR